MFLDFANAMFKFDAMFLSSGSVDLNETQVV